MKNLATPLSLKVRAKIALLYVWFIGQAHVYATRRVLVALVTVAKHKIGAADARLRSKLARLHPRHLSAYFSALFSRTRSEIPIPNSRWRRVASKYQRVWDWGISQLFEHFEKKMPDSTVLAHFVRKCAAGNASPQLISSTAALAVSMDNTDQAKELFSDLLHRFPDEASIHQQLGIRAFILGKYSLAEELWTQSVLLREQRIVDLGLDHLQVRFLGPSWILAIGHIAHLDSYFKHRTLYGREKTKAYLYPPKGFHIPNKELLARWSGLIEEMDERVVGRFSSKEIGLLQDEFWSLQFKNGQSRMFSHAGAIVQRQWQSEGRPPLLSLSDQDREVGQAELEKLGIPRGAWFVCLHVREPGFHLKWHKSHPGTRNADIRTYQPAAREIVARGGYVVRVGDPTMTTILEEPGIVDYAHSQLRSEFMDIFLCAACKFFIGTNSGLGLVPPIFGVPCALTNWSPIGLPQWYPNDMYIPKLLYSERLNRNLTFEEMLFSQAGWGQFEKHLANSGLRAVDNTEDELTELVLEMLERESGKEILTEEDQKRIDAFNDLAVRAGSYVGGRIGKGFLRRHADLITISATDKSRESYLNLIKRTARS